MNAIRSVCVYCGSSAGRDPDYVESGRRLGRDMAEAGMRLVYGGGTRGIMGAVSDGVIMAGGQVTGIIPRFLIDMEATERELKRLDELVVTDDMHERKHLMFQRSDAFVALPGGIGTLEELVEIMTWSQLGRHAKPIVIANIGGAFDFQIFGVGDIAAMNDDQARDDFDIFFVQIGPPRDFADQPVD